MLGIYSTLQLEHKSLECNRPVGTNDEENCMLEHNRNSFCLNPVPFCSLLKQQSNHNSNILASAVLFIINYKNLASTKASQVVHFTMVLELLLQFSI